MRQLAIAWSLATVTAPSPSSAASPCDAAIRTQDVDEAAFRAATALRLPQLRLREATSDIDETCSNQLRAFVDQLPKGQREAVRTLALEEYSLEAASKATGRTKTSLKVNLHRAIKTLRGRMSGVER